MNVFIIKEEFILKSKNSTKIKLLKTQYNINHSTAEKLANYLNLFIAKTNYTRY